MKAKIIIAGISFFVLNLPVIYAQSKVKVSTKDFQLLTGEWKGTLTYLDYTSNKPYSMTADIIIKQINKSKAYIFSNIYPNEPNANSSDTLVISNKGKMIDKSTVKLKRKLINGDTEIITEFLSIDGNDNKPAVIRITYTFGKDTYTNKKEVQFVGEHKWIKRHEFSYTRK